MTNKNEVKIEIPFHFKELFDPQYRFKLYYGGRGSAKSHSVGRSLLIKARQKQINIACVREVQRSIKDSVHKLLSDLITQYDLSDFNVTDTYIKNVITGSRFIFKGCLDRNKSSRESIKSLEGIDICWVEEAQSISKESLDVLIPTIRNPNSEIWFTFNRYDQKDPVWEEFCIVPDPKILVKKVNYTDNIFCPQELVDQAERCKLLHPDDYAHIWEGEPKVRKEGAVYKFNSLSMSIPGLREKLLKELPDQEILRIWDFGLYPACVFCAVTPFGLRTLYELTPKTRPTLSEFIPQVTFYSNSLFAGRNFKDLCDIAGKQTSSQTGKTSIDILNENSIYPEYFSVPIEDGIINMQRLIDKPDGFLVDTDCKEVIDALNGGYYRKEDKTGLGKEMPPEQKHPSEDVMDCLRYAVWAYYKPNITIDADYKKILTAAQSYQEEFEI